MKITTSGKDHAKGELSRGDKPEIQQAKGNSLGNNFPTWEVCTDRITKASTGEKASSMSEATLINIQINNREIC